VKLTTHMQLVTMLRKSWWRSTWLSTGTTLKLCYCTHNSHKTLPLDPILVISRVDIHTHCTFNIHFNIILLSRPWIPRIVSSPYSSKRNCLHFFSSPLISFMHATYPFHRMVTYISLFWTQHVICANCEVPRHVLSSFAIYFISLWHKSLPVHVLTVVCDLQNTVLHFLALF
jgi:hypothetical protein